MTADITPIIAAIVGAAVVLFVALGSLVLVLFNGLRADLRADVTEIRSDIRDVRQDVKRLLEQQPAPSAAEVPPIWSSGLGHVPISSEAIEAARSIMVHGAYDRVIAEMAAKEAAREAQAGAPDESPPAA